MTNDLLRLARQFRTCLDDRRLRHAYPEYLRDKLASFPKDACGHASVLLALYLQEKGFMDVDYVVGRRGKNGESHAWLEIGATIIDITADQFPDVCEPVIVTEDHAWYSAFYGQQRQHASGDFQEYCAEARKDYEKAYTEIRKRLPQD
jgi:hypothetical protein